MVELAVRGGPKSGRQHSVGRPLAAAPAPGACEGPPLHVVLQLTGPVGPTACLCGPELAAGSWRTRSFCGSGVKRSLKKSKMLDFLKKTIPWINLRVAQLLARFHMFFSRVFCICILRLGQRVLYGIIPIDLRGPGARRNKLAQRGPKQIARQHAAARSPEVRRRSCTPVARQKVPASVPQRPPTSKAAPARPRQVRMSRRLRWALLSAAHPGWISARG